MVVSRRAFAPRGDLGRKQTLHLVENDRARERLHRANDAYAPARSNARITASISTLAARLAPSTLSVWGVAVGVALRPEGVDAASALSVRLRALALARASRVGVVLAMSRRGVCASAMDDGDGGVGVVRRAVRTRPECARVQKNDNL